MSRQGQRIPITPILGMDNASPDEALRRMEPPGNMVRDAVNVDIEDTGRFSLRRGLRCVTNEPYQWLWQSPLTGTVFGSLRGQWVQVHTHDWSSTPLADVGEGRCAHLQLGGAVVCAAPRGLFIFGGKRALPLGLPTPPAPMLAPVDGAGSMEAGRYGAAIAWKRGELLSPLSPLAQAELTGTGALRVTFPVALGAEQAGIDGVRLFLTNWNGGELLRAGDYRMDAGGMAAQVELPLLPKLGEAARWRHCTPMPTGEHLGLWRGRLVTASGRTLHFSEPMAYHIKDTRHGFVQMPQSITFIAPVEGGIWVGQRTHVEFLAGSTPAELTLTGRAGKAPVPFSAVMLDAEDAGEMAGGGRAAVAWLAGNGFVLGTADGSMVETQARHLRGITGTHGSSAVLHGRIAAAVH